MDKLPRIDGRGGLIAVDARGEVSLPFNTEGMYRGWVRVGERRWSAIYADEGGARTDMQHHQPRRRRVLSRCAT
jgi:beta-aspartyl-peptidase (threonine type)